MPDHDVLIVGSGLAGLAAALSVQDRRVTILTSWMPPGGTASAMAQGGIAAAVGADDSPAQHLADTLRAGAGACNAKAARTLCEEAPSAIAWLEAQGVVFDRKGADYSLHREGAHSRARVLHVNHDRSGLGILKAVTRVARARPDIQILSGHTAVSLLTGSRGVEGVLAQDRHAKLLRIRANQTVLATGGLGQLYLHTTNPRNACGDGLALALAAGAHCAALEYVQFHPTALCVPADPLPLLTEALRGAGARLIDAAGCEFMRAAHPLADLAPRDVVAREVWRRTTAGHRVYLDAREALSREPEAFPSVRNLCAQQHLDPARDLLPVTAAAHYHMGGVDVDLDGRTSLERLWACGEVACTGAHGANRLASNSLLEAVVFGRRLGHALSGASGPVSGSAPSRHQSDEDFTLDVDTQAWSQVREIMWRGVGIVRDAPGLERALEQLARIAAAIPARQGLMKGRLRLAQAIALAALANSRSMGSHFRADESVAACPRAAG